jgi:hypothetical protein
MLEERVPPLSEPCARVPRKIETQVIIAENLGYFSSEQGRALLTAAAELGRILNGLMASIKGGNSDEKRGR